VPKFRRYIGIDYSGAETPTSSLSALRVYSADIQQQPSEVQPPPSPRRYWTRRGIAEWLLEELSKAEPTIVGIDHAFSFPLEYFQKHGLPLDWPSFLEDFRNHWPTHEDHTYVDFIRDEFCAREGEACWLRLTERWTAAAKSVFRFDVQGAVAKSTHAGLPWLLYLKVHCGDRIHFWPFDGWDIPSGKSAVVEVYPSLWMRRFPTDGRNGDQHAAYAVSAWLQRADNEGSLQGFLHPRLNPSEQSQAQVEGWILGVM
jgi:hypothetical protein